jgi:hypothetical protein
MNEHTSDSDGDEPRDDRTGRTDHDDDETVDDAGATGATTDPDGVDTQTATDRSADSVGSERFRRWVNYLVLAALALLALVAGVRFYGATSTTINRFVASEFQSLFQAAFNLALVLLAAAGVSLQLRRLR